jgi:anaerobic dimethyl sulfoxide reductase subunit C (anchor subunit)
MKQIKHNEWPLVIFTMLTQMAVGTFLLWGLPAVFLPSPNPFNTDKLPIVILCVILAALILGALAAASHLGRAFGAVFSLSNWRSSWLSREALLAAGFGMIVLLVLILQVVGIQLGFLNRLLILAGCVVGGVLVWGIAQLYKLRTVPAWNNRGTTVSFFATSLLTGTSALIITWILMIFTYDAYASEPIFGWLMMISKGMILLLVVIQVVVFISTLVKLRRQGGAGAESVRILWKNLRYVLFWRWVMAGAGGLLIILWLPPIFILLPYVLVLISEFLGRYLFYSFYQRTGF